MFYMQILAFRISAGPGFRKKMMLLLISDAECFSYI